jgi:hypothetical protein
MLSRNLTLLLVGLAIAALTLLISWRLGFVFFLLPLFFFWSWGGRGGVRRPDEDLGPANEAADGGLADIDEAEDAGLADADEAEDGGLADDYDDGGARRTGPGPQPPAGRGVDGEGI